MVELVLLKCPKCKKQRVGKITDGQFICNACRQRLGIGIFSRNASRKQKLEAISVRTNERRVKRVKHVCANKDDICHGIIRRLDTLVTDSLWMCTHHRQITNYGECALCKWSNRK